MSEQNKTVARRLFEVLNRHQLTGIDEIVAADAVIRANHLPEARGPEAIKAMFSQTFSAFPDVQYTLHSVIGEGDEVAIRWSGAGTHKGSWMGAAPTGREMTVSGTTTLRIVDGKIVEHWADWDALGQMMQLGISPDVVAS